MTRWFLILILLTHTAETLGHHVKSPKTPPKAFSKVVVQLSGAYLKDHPKAQVRVQITPTKGQNLHKQLEAQCKGNKLDCQFYPDFSNPQLLNLTMVGQKKSLQNILNWLKKNAKMYQEKTHTKK